MAKSTLPIGLFLIKVSAMSPFPKYLAKKDFANAVERWPELPKAKRESLGHDLLVSATVDALRSPGNITKLNSIKSAKISPRDRKKVIEWIKEYSHCVVDEDSNVVYSKEKRKALMDYIRQEGFSVDYDSNTGKCEFDIDDAFYHLHKTYTPYHEMKIQPRRPKTPLVAHKSIVDLANRILNTEDDEERELDVNVDLSNQAIRNLEAVINNIIDNRRRIKARDERVADLVKRDLKEHTES